MTRCYPGGAMDVIRGTWKWGVTTLLAAGFVAGAIGLTVSGSSSGEQPPIAPTLVPAITEVPVLAITEIPVPLVTEVPVPVVTEVLVPVVTEVLVPVVTEVPVLLPPPQCATQQDIDNTLAWLEEARATHVVWADYLDTHQLQDPLAKQGLGTADYHRLWVARYTTMIGVAQAIQGIC